MTTNTGIDQNGIFTTLSVSNTTILNGEVKLNDSSIFGDLNVNGIITSTSAPTFSGLTYPSTDGSIGQIMTTDGSGNLSWQTPVGTGNVIGTGTSTVNTIPIITNTSTTGIGPSSVLLNPLTGDITCNKITSESNQVTVTSILGNINSVPIYTGTNNIFSPSSVTIDTLTGDITTQGTLNTNSGPIVTSSATPNVNSVPVFDQPNNLVASTVLIDPILGDITTLGIITSNNKQVVVGSGTSVINNVPVISNTSTTSIIPSSVSISGGNIVTAGTLQSGGLTYPNTDGTIGQVLTTDGNGTLIFTTLSGNVSGSGISVVNQVPVISNTSTSSIIPSSVTINPLNGNINTPGTITSGSGNVVSGTGISSINQVPVLNNLVTSSIVPSNVIINPLNGNINTPGSLTTGVNIFPTTGGTIGQVLTTNGSGVLSFTTLGGGNVSGSGISVVNQVPVISNTSTTSIVPSPVTIDPINGNINTIGTITSGSGNVVVGSGISVVNNVPVISDTSTTSIIPSSVSISGGNIVTAGTLQSGGLTYPNTDGTIGQVLTTNGIGVLSFTTLSGGNVSGSGISVVNQVPVISDTSTSSIIPSSVSISGGNIVGVNSITTNDLICINGPTIGNYTQSNIDGNVGDVMTTDGLGQVLFKPVPVAKKQILGNFSGSIYSMSEIKFGIGDTLETDGIATPNIFLISLMSCDYATTPSYFIHYNFLFSTAAAQSLPSDNIFTILGAAVPWFPAESRNYFDLSQFKSSTGYNTPWMGIPSLKTIDTMVLNDPVSVKLTLSYPDVLSTYVNDQFVEKRNLWNGKPFPGFRYVGVMYDTAPTISQTGYITQAVRLEIIGVWQDNAGKFIQIYADTTTSYVSNPLIGSFDDLSRPNFTVEYVGTEWKFTFSDTTPTIEYVNIISNVITFVNIVGYSMTRII